MYFKRCARVFQISNFSSLSIFHAFNLIDKRLSENSSLNLILKKQVMSKNRTPCTSCDSALIDWLSRISAYLSLFLLEFFFLLPGWLDFEIIIGKHELHFFIQVFGKLKILLSFGFTFWFCGTLI